MSEDVVYTAITFAPVQSFIERSRKLRDLYGSSFLLSYLAGAVCEAARAYTEVIPLPGQQQIFGYPVISPALIDQTQGTPNQLVIAGHFPKADAEKAFHQAWQTVMDTCRMEIETSLPSFNYAGWNRDWNLWASHTWEFFWAIGQTISQARDNLQAVKRSRAWTGINWQGESSSLSGADSIAYPGMGRRGHAKRRSQSQEDAEIKAFYECLSQEVGEATIPPNEELSIPELVKRLVTLEAIARKLPDIEQPHSYKYLNRWQGEESDREEAKRWTGWFKGDGDRAGHYLRNLLGDDPVRTNQFSLAMRQWGSTLHQALPLSPGKKQVRDGRIIYAGGDDFLGVFYRNDAACPLQPKDCLRWFYRFQPDLWSTHKQPITVSVGFVWSAPNVPQRDVLQHCREAEKAAKQSGRDRLAARILFNSGNYLEWVCPWWFLEPVLEGYRDRDGKTGTEANWVHFYNDSAMLEARHAFAGNQTDVALGLFAIYFGQETRETLEQHLWDSGDRSGILGNAKVDCPDLPQTLNTWIMNLAKVGFHLCSST